MVTWPVLSVGVGLFLPAVPPDPIIAGGVMLWYLALVGLAELGRAWERPAGDAELRGRMAAHLAG